MKKKKVFSILASASMAIGLMMMPVSVNAISSSKAPEYFEEGENHSKPNVYTGEFFANGTPITISATSTEGKAAKITWDGGSQEVDDDDAIYGGSDSTSSNVELESTSITMNGGKVKLLIAGNKMMNETNSQKSTVGTATVDINGGEITQGLSGIDNQNTAFGPDVMKNERYKNYSIATLNVTIDNAKVKDFRGVTSYAYVDKMNLTVGKDVKAELGKMFFGTNGVINEANFTMYGGKTDLASSILRSKVLTKMTYNFLAGEVGEIYAGSYYPEEETAAGTEDWKGWTAGGVDYGFANEIVINVSDGVVYKDIISGFQFRKDDIQKFKEKYPNETWRIEGLKENAKVTLNLAEIFSADAKDKNSLIDSTATNIKTNWLVTDVKLDKTTATLDEGKTIDLKATVNPTNATDKTVTWASSNTKVATVDATGKVTAIAEGTATITATAGSKNATCTVTVTKVPVPVEPEKPVVPNTPTVEVPTIDPTTPPKEVTVGVQDKESQKVISETVISILGNITSGKEVSKEVMSEETLNAVKKALDEGKTVTPKVEASAVDVKSIDKAVINKVNELVEKFSKVNDTKATVAQYLDLGVLLMADGNELGTVNKLDKAIEFTVALPTELAKEGRVFYVVRIHDGVAERLVTTMNEDGTITFETDKFSTYAIVYEEATTTETTKKDETVKTSDDTQAMLIASIGGLAVVGAGIVVMLKKREELMK